MSARIPFTGETGAKADALNTATRHCETLGKRILLQHETSGECALHGGCGEAEVTFLCLKPDDPRYTLAK